MPVETAMQRAVGKLTAGQQQELLPILEQILVDVMIDEGGEKSTDKTASERAAITYGLSQAIKAVRAMIEKQPTYAAPPKRIVHQ